MSDHRTNNRCCDCGTEIANRSTRCRPCAVAAGATGSGWNRGLTKSTDERVARQGAAVTGRVTSEATKEKQRLAHLGRKYKPMSDEGRENIRRGHLGYVIPEAHRRKLSEANKGIKRTLEQRIAQGERQKGEKGVGWKGGVTSEHRVQRKSLRFKLWREAVFARDDWTCRKCNLKGQNGHGKRVVLHPHHLDSFASHPELRFEVDNGATLCADCHNGFHRIYGNDGSNTRAQYEEWIGEP